MSSERWRRIEDLYHQALNQPFENQDAFLDAACGNDAELRSEVESLLHAATKDVAFLDRPIPARNVSGRPAMGSRLGPYLIGNLLGAGGMGDVFRATDSRLHRTVAIKILSPDRLADSNHKRRFLQEARAVSALNHPNIVVLHDISHHEGIDFIVMEYVAGKTLQESIAPGGLPLDEVLHIGFQAASALAAAHSAGIVHRDIKPANIMISPENQVKVLDFGVAKLDIQDPGQPPEDDQTRTRLMGTKPGVIVGTISYMSPEQTRGEPLDGRSDLFSLGAVLYLASTGRLPFSGASALSIMHEIATARPPAPSSVRTDLPLEFDHIVERALAKDRDQRFRSASELAQAIEALRANNHAQLLSGGSTVSQQQPLVGRESELRKLQGLLARTVAGSGRFVLLSGEPGIGKSALARSFLQNAARLHPGLLIGHGACVEQYGAGEAYLPFLQALPGLLAGARGERVIALLRRHAPTWCLQFPSLFSGNALDQLQRDAIGATKERMLRELGDAMEAITAVFPIVLLIEDLHWADAPSIDLIRHLGQRSREQRLLLLGTARADEQERGYQLLKNCRRELATQSASEDVTLEALDGENLARYLNAYFSPNTFPAELAAMIYRKTEGHPLFTTGVFQLLAERGDVARRDGAWRLTRPAGDIGLAAPESVRSMINRKLEGLDEEDRRLLQYASVQGEEFLSAVLAASLSIDELSLEDRLDRLDRSNRLIRTIGEEELPDGSLTIRYRFAHALYQSFLYADILAKRKALLHLQAGQSLARCYQGQTAKIAAALATHFERGRDFPQAIAFLSQAGDNAVALLVHGQACEYYSRGLELTEKLPEEVRPSSRMVLLKKRGDSNLSRGMSANAESDYRSVLAAASDVRQPATECRALIDLANVHIYTRKPDEMAASASAALEIAGRIGNQALWCEATGQLAASCQVVGRVEDAHQLYNQAIPMARALQHTPALLQSLTYRGVAHFFHSDYANAVAAESEAVQLASDARNGFYLALSNTYLGYSLANQGRVSEALAALQQAVDLARRNENRIVLSRAPNGIGWIYREIGMLRSAIDYDEACAETARDVGATEAEANALINLVYDYTLTGHPDRAMAAMRRVNSLYDRELWNRWRFHEIREQAAAAEFWLVEGNLDRAEEHARRLLASAECYGVPKYVAVARRILGEISLASGDFNRAEDELLRSFEPLRQRAIPLTEWRNHAALGRTLQKRGDRPAAARDSFSRAAEGIRKIASTIEDPQHTSAFLEQSEIRAILHAAG